MRWPTLTLSDNAASMMMMKRQVPSRMIPQPRSWNILPSAVEIVQRVAVDSELIVAQKPPAPQSDEGLDRLDQAERPGALQEAVD